MLFYGWSDLLVQVVRFGCFCDRWTYLSYADGFIDFLLSRKRTDIRLLHSQQKWNTACKIHIYSNFWWLKWEFENATKEFYRKNREKNGFRNYCLFASLSVRGTSLLLDIKFYTPAHTPPWYRHWGLLHNSNKMALYYLLWNQRKGYIFKLALIFVLLPQCTHKRGPIAVGFLLNFKSSWCWYICYWW